MGLIHEDQHAAAVARFFRDEAPQCAAQVR
jgi:hypothetical protein